MKEVRCKSGNVYGLALGPLILSELEADVSSLLPAAALDRIMKHAQAEGKDLSQMEQEDFMAVMTGDEVAEYYRAEKRQIPNMLKRCVRIFNDERISDLDQFLSEEMDVGDVNEVMEVVTGALEAYKTGLEREGESLPSSAQRGAEAKA